jgi:release factor glutamine methyltransferase
MATEISPAAAAIARGNIARLVPDRNIEVLEGSLLEPVDPAWRGQVDVIASNPPYIPSGEIEGLQPEVSGHEPGLALDGGPDGLDVIRRLAASARLWLRPGGWLLCEVAMGQSCAVARILAGNGLDSIRLERDLAGIERVVIGQRPAGNRTG